MTNCNHEHVYPDGTCAKCDVLATVCPGLSDAHKMIPYPPDHRKAKKK